MERGDESYTRSTGECTIYQIIGLRAINSTDERGKENAAKVIGTIGSSFFTVSRITSCVMRFEEVDIKIQFCNDTNFNVIFVADL